MDVLKEIKLSATEPNEVRCLNCGSPCVSYWTQAVDVEYETIPDAYNYYHCNECGVLFIDPVPSPEDLKQIYPPDYYSFNQAKTSFTLWVKEKLDQRFFRGILKGIKGEQLRVLDVGGGSGRMLDILRLSDPRVKDTWIVDLDQKAAEVAIAKGHNFKLGRIEEFSEPGKFDLILAFNLIEHVRDPLSVLTKLKTCLKHEGVIVIKTPNYKSLDAQIFRHGNWGGYHCPRHWVLFDIVSFTSLVNKVGLRIQNFKYTQGAPFWAISFLHFMQIRTRPLYLSRWFGLVSILAAFIDILRSPFGRLSQMLFVIKN